jgi:5-formyltetrahydrofolate cyclo-ligase
MLDKASLRLRLSTVRSALTTAQVDASSTAIRTRLLDADFMAGSDVFLVYVSVGKEVETRALIDQLLAAKKRVAVPLVVGSTRMEACEILPDCKWKIGRFGVPVPESSRPFEGSLDVCVVPGLAFSCGCDRLGFGRGHWDRFFERARVGTIVGLCHDCQVVDHLPVEATDRPADRVVTERRLLHRIL